MEEVFVTNTGESEHSDRFHGKEYKFPVGESVKVPLEFAIECLGYGWDDKSPYIVRLGWSVTANDMPQALERLEKIKITNEPLEQNRSLPSTVGEVTPFPSTGRGRKSATRAA